MEKIVINKEKNMNFCRLYNKTRIWIDDKLFDPTTDTNQKYKPVESVFIPTGILYLILLLLLQIVIMPIIYIIYYTGYIFTSKCDLKETKEE